MTKQIRHALTLAAAGLLAACASTPSPSAVEVTRFHDSARLAEAGNQAVFVASAPDSEDSALALAPYKAAVADQLARLGFGEGSAEDSGLVAQVTTKHFTLGADTSRRGPVSVGVGGSTGSYGSGLGLGLGINLGGGSSERAGTELNVMLRDRESGKAVWEGRAQITVSPKSELAEPARNAQILADALFREFPGNNGETIEVEVSE